MVEFTMCSFQWRMQKIISEEISLMTTYKKKKDYSFFFTWSSTVKIKVSGEVQPP